MKRSFGLVVLSAAVLVVGGCSSGSATSSSGTAAVGSSAAGSAPAGSSVAPSVVAPIELDTQTVAWFDTLCTGLAKSVQPFRTWQSGLEDPSLSPSAVAAAVQAAGAAFGETASSLASTPPPTFDGGGQLAGTITAGVNDAATQFPQSAARFAALDPNDAAGIATAKTTLKNELVTALSALTTISQLPPGQRDAVEVIPACKALAT